MSNKSTAIDIEDNLGPEESTSADCSDEKRVFDWDFKVRVAEEIDAIHPYPAKFIPEIPKQLLAEFPRPSGIVVDPFSGSGTTLVQCQKAGVTSAGIDLNPIACLIARVKTSPLPSGIRDAVEGVLHVAGQIAPDIPLIPRLDHWFETSVQRELAALIAAIDAAAPEFEDVLRLALSSIIVRVSNQESDTRYAAVAKPRLKEGVRGVYRTAAERIIKALECRNYSLNEARVYNSNTLDFDWNEISEPVAAVITSPPYPNAYEYWLYHKYRMYWLGYDPISVKEQEIGARAHFFKKNHHTAEDFSRQMRGVLEDLAEKLAPKGYAAFVVGRSKIHGEIVDNAELIRAAGAEFGFKVKYRSERTIAASRKSFNLSHANIKTETIIVLSK
ncbi:RNA methyltransferase (plasmid) [Roseibium aggregatum]|uniref:DNA methyltransferase n=1 Tax=Roseibium aggregatum TaxID=187304 RepID=UPI001E6066E7|nr:DNA methyltransferase [Roseibium aggregatum]UES60233.1 RNA methyltransferase [Roseibium aggregatum]